MGILNLQFRPAFAWFLLAGFTDFADGFTARRFHWSSQFGAYLDPLADKILMASVFVALGVVGAAPLWLVALVFARDLMIVSGALWIASKTGNRSFPPSWLGKTSTTVQIVSVTVFLGVAAGFAPDWLREWGVWCTAAAALASGLDYLRLGARMWRSGGRKQA